MRRIKTVLGEIRKPDAGITLVHEHVCCYSNSLYQMVGKDYLDKERLAAVATDFLKSLKETYGLTTFVDCTPVNIGRDVALLKEVSEKSGVHIVCATGFYYTDEPILHAASPELLAGFMIADAKKVNAGIIKCAVEREELSPFDVKLLRASAMAQLTLQLPIVLHTNAKNKNGLKALELLRSEGVKPQAITVGHLSDTEDLEYVKQIAAHGCFIGFDRLYGKTSEDYVRQKLAAVTALCEAGCEDQLLLSHDALFFNGFEATPAIKEAPRFSYCFDHILPRLSSRLAEKIMMENPAKMLMCGE